MKFTIVNEQGRRRLACVRGTDAAVLPAQFDALCELSALARIGPDDLARLSQQAGQLAAGAWRPLAQFEIALPFTQPGKVVCLGLNYADHAKEGGHAVPEYPSLFLRVPTSLVAAGQPMICPGVSDKFDYEAELLAIIGRGGRHIAAEDALDHVFGYSCFNDGSVRDYQRKTAQWTAGKNFDATGAIGPVIVTADELPPGAAGLAIACRLNGNTVQDASTSQMLVSVAHAIAIISEIMTLLPGDVIAMGTPQGVGIARKPPLLMKDGDTVEVEIEGIGILRSPIRAETTVAVKA